MNHKISQKYQSLKPNLHIIFRSLFENSLSTYLILLLLEIIKPGFVSFFFNLNNLLVVVLVSGLVMIFAENEELDTGGNVGDIWPFILMLSVGSQFLVFYKTHHLGMISLFVSLLAFILITLLAFLIYSED
jgi:hypothetical protein